MRILHFVSSFAPGGAEVYVRNLACKMKEKGVEQSIYALDDARDLRKEDKEAIFFQEEYIELLKEKRISWGFLESRARKNFVQGICSVKRIIRTEKPDLIHSHVSGISSYLVLANMRVPMLFTHHSTPVRHPYFHKYLLRRSIEKYIAVSEAGKKALLEIGVPTNKITKIFNGIPLDQFQCKREVSGEVRTLLAVGRLNRPKNYPLMLRSFRRVVCQCEEKSIEPPVLKIVGDGDLKEDLRKLSVELKIQNRVHFLGIRRDIPKLLSDSDIFVISSDWEGLSIALIEALASGISVIATDVGGNGEILENGQSGLLSKPGDEEHLAKNIMKLIQSKELREGLCLRAVERSASFSIEDACLEHIDTYNEILQQKQAANIHLKS